MGNEEIRALRDSVRGLLSKRSNVRAAIETPLGYDDKLWSTLCEQIGVAALAVPEEYGGFGAGLAEVAVVLEELGRTLTPSPMLGSVLCTYALLATGNPEACARLLPSIADGSRIAALAWAGEQGWSSPGCSAAGTKIHGSACYVLDGDIADVLLVPARTGDEVGLFEVAASGVSRRHTPGMDLTRRLAVADFPGVSAVRLDRGGFPLRRVHDLALVALSAEQVGVAARALELTVDYTKQRRQFGRPIGSFQALKHRMADAFVRVEAARSASHAALRSESSLDAAVAKVVCSEAAEFVTAEMIQLHGGIAITWEHDAHLYFKRAHGSAQLFGSVSETMAGVDWLS
ncbi:MAG TPA: acyl-CoA dehydrogenase family protein [Amycolatopsis sp.]|uniref:acyl-CoA dehydrogenase family protein n=1 Tax=Amycolatopsis sp. TaxID=37632 RepID=UPI002B47FB35|nr:acyl-CoA dehydrogenase family protein [Amycolatopsis sp.]HKS46516.1 acyl-CoA dehydrogenase family protein [Amycolatopsis sp.]